MLDNIIFSIITSIISVGIFLLIIKLFLKKDRKFKMSIEEITAIILSSIISSVLELGLIQNGIVEKSWFSGRRNPLSFLLNLSVLFIIWTVIFLFKKIFLNKNSKNTRIKRNTKEHVVKEYRKNNPNATKMDCIKETGLARQTVYKWWD